MSKSISVSVRNPLLIRSSASGEPIPPHPINVSFFCFRVFVKFSGMNDSVFCLVYLIFLEG